MKLKYKYLILLFIFFASSLTAAANDTIVAIKRCAGWEIPSVCATQGKQFSVDWGDGTPIETYTGTGLTESLYHTYSFTGGRYRMLITANSEDCLLTVFDPDRADTIDLSKCPSIKVLYISFVARTLKDMNVSNCSKLEVINADGHKLTTLDLSDCISFQELMCEKNQLTQIKYTVITFIACIGNRLPLSNLYPISEMINNPYRKFLGRQEFHTQRLAVGDSVDYSSENEFGGIKTLYKVEKGGALAPPENYSINNGVFTFYKSGLYTITMFNPAIVSHPEHPAIAIAPINVINFVPVTEIINLPATATVDMPLTLTGTVVPDNATYQYINWSICDAGTTGATLKGRTLHTTNPGTVTITATITDGTAIGKEYTQNFSIEVEPMGIFEPALAQSIMLFPNPTTGEFTIKNEQLIINNIGVFDVFGRKVGAKFPSNKLEGWTRSGRGGKEGWQQQADGVVLDISHLPAGIYFVKIFTEKGEIVKKIVKQ